MASPFLYDVLAEAEPAHGLVLLDKGVTYVTSSALDEVVGAKLPRDITPDTIGTIRSRFSRWMSLFRSPHIQTVDGVVDEVFREHGLLNHRIRDLSKAANAAFEEDVLSEYDYTIHQKYLGDLVQLRDDFAIRPYFTKQSKYVSRSPRSHRALVSEVIRFSNKHQLKQGPGKKHDSTSTTDEQLVAAALDYDTHYDSGVAVVTNDSDVTKILNKFSELNPVRNQVSVYSLYEKNTQRNVYKPQARVEEPLVFSKR